MQLTGVKLTVKSTKLLVIFMLIRRLSAQQVSRERIRQVTRLVLYLCDGLPTSLCGAVRGAIYLARLFEREKKSHIC